MSVKEDNVVCGCWQHSFVFSPYKDIESMIFFCSLASDLASAQLTCATLESSS